MVPSLDSVDAELTRWRERLAAASRNVAELAELPEFAAARTAARGTGRLAEAARSVVATMDELWAGVLLIGAALDRAEQARKTGSRLWRAEEAAGQALAILHGPSITVDLAETPVLHRRLLGAPRAAATVSPDSLLQTMDAAFDRARATLARITEAAAAAAALQTRLAAATARLPAFAERLQATALPDPLDRLEALEALAAIVDPALAAADQARTALAAARHRLAALAAAATQAGTAAGAAVAIAVPIPPVDDAERHELSAWLDRLTRTLDAGRTEACTLGLANWQALHDRVAAGLHAREAAATAALARRDELRGRFGAFRMKRRARPAASGLDALEETARTTLAAEPLDLDAAARALAAYEAALANS